MRRTSFFVFCSLLLFVLSACSIAQTPASDTYSNDVQTVEYLEPDHDGRIEIPPEGIILESYEGLPPPLACTSDFCLDAEGQEK